MQVTFTGQDKVIQRLMQMQKQILASAPRGLTNASYKLRDGAVETLISRIGVSRWGAWPKSQEGAIRDKRTWGVSKVSQTEVMLRSNSKHSAAVELGTLNKGIMHASTYGMKGFPVGLSQGNLVAMSATIRPQPGKYYLTQAMNNPAIHNQMLDELAKVIRQAIGV